MRRFNYLLLFLINTYNQYNVCQATPLDGIYVRDASKNEALFSVSIAVKDVNNVEIHICGGALITKKHVLTSAHCREYDLSRYVIRVESNDLGDKEKVKKYSVKCWTTYDRWARQHNEIGDTADNDISIIELCENVSPSIKLARISKQPSTEFYGTQAKTAVWDGSIEDPLRKLLKIVLLDVLSPEQFATNIKKACKAPYDDQLAPNLLATSTTPSTHLEPSNSGSPLFVNDNEIIGINDSTETLRRGTCVILKQNLHISIEHYRNFIRSVTRSESSCTSSCTMQ